MGPHVHDTRVGISASIEPQFTNSLAHAAHPHTHFYCIPLCRRTELGTTALHQAVRTTHAAPRGTTSPCTPFALSVCCMHAGEKGRGETDRHTAAVFTQVWRNALPAIQLLLQSGADPNTQDTESGWCVPRTTATCAHTLLLVRSLLHPRRHPSTSVLLRTLHGATALPCCCHRSPLHKALYQGSLGAAALLLAHGASTDLLDSKVGDAAAQHPCMCP